MHQFTAWQFAAAADNAAAQADADIILRTFIGMAFIMVLMWLAVIITGRIGKMHRDAADSRKEEMNEPDDVHLQNDEQEN